MMLNARIQRAAPEDLQAILALVNRAYEREYWLIPGPRLKGLEALRDEFEAPGNTLLVAKAMGKVLGVIRLTLPFEGSSHAQPRFGLLAVDPSAQGAGLARGLIFAAEELVMDAGYVEMHLECLDDMGLPQMYERLGYEVIGSTSEARWGSKIPFVLLRMRKRFIECLEDSLPGTEVPPVQPHA